MIKFSYYKNYKGNDCLNVGKYNPFYRGKSYKKLVPSKELFSWWDSIENKNKKKYFEEFYARYKKETLDKLDFNEVYKDINNKVIITFTKDCPIREALKLWLKDNNKKYQEF